MKQYKKTLEATIIAFNQWWKKNRNLYSHNDRKGIFLNTLKRELKKSFPEIPMRTYHDNLNIDMFSISIGMDGLENISFPIPQYVNQHKEIILKGINQGLIGIDYFSLQIKSTLDFTNSEIDANQIINSIANFKFK